MLYPKKDRLDYGEQLMPPEGYVFKFAIGTSYSLDLEALMILPVALFYSQQLDENAENIRYDMLDAITKSAGKVILYCQKGKIHVPKEYHYLLAYVENAIEEVSVNHKAQSFHPKVWILRYESEDKPVRYRILVTSRNLTFSRDWDVAFSSDGEVGIEKVKRTEPIIHFLRYLNAKGKRKIPREFIEDLEKVDFEIPEGFKLINFFPIGIPLPEDHKDYENPLKTKKWDDLLIVSPFVQENIIDNLSDRTGRNIWLLSRKEELDSLKKKTLEKVEAYKFSRFIQDAEYNENISEEGTEARAQNLHAKLFIGLKNDSPFWYLGSANASDPAFGRNIEFIIELKGEGYNQKPKTILNILTKDKKSEVILFEPYKIEEKQDQEERKRNSIVIRDITFTLTNLIINGIAKQTTNIQLYDLVIEVDASKLKLPENYNVRLKPLPLKDKKSIIIEPGQDNIIEEYRGFTVTQLSPFIIWEIYNKDELQKQFLIQMCIELPEARMGKIFTSIINSREKFFKYLTFLLTGNETENIETNRTGMMNLFKEHQASSSFEIPDIQIFEKLMIAASRYPDRLKSIDNLIQKLKQEETENKENIIIDEFERFWRTFLKYRKNIF